jgi:dihydrofolate synthase/folylpolyglutamate synthase
MTYFEATTLLQFEAFARAGVELAAVEVGLGGRLDATNVVAPDLALVTGVARDHERELGSDLAGIAREKAGIFKAGVPALVGDPEPAEVGAALTETAARVGAPLARLADEARWRVRGVEPGRTRFDYVSDGARLEDLDLPLTGAHFAAGAALGLRAWERLAGAGAVPPLDADLARAALAALPLGGRGEWRVVEGVPHLLDAAHNPAGCERLAATAAALERGRAALVFGALADKAWPEMLDALLPAAARAWACDLETAGPRRLTRAEAEPVIAARGIAWAGTVAEGLAAARAAVLAGDAAFVLVAGSFHTVGEALVTLGVAREGEPYTPERPALALAR